jgi:hypothetical protein
VRPAGGDKPATAGGPSRRRRAEVGFLRAAGSCGIVGVGAAIGAILGSQDVSGWITGLVVALVSVALAALLRVTLRS